MTTERDLVARAKAIFENCTVESGVCCCGDPMEEHPHPIACGHSPVDSGSYAVAKWMEAAAKPAPLTLNEYQARARETAIYPNQGDFLGLVYVGLKLAGEAGEVAENVGKAMRDDDAINLGELKTARRIGLAKEAGDVLWYLAQLATELGVTLEQLAEMNLHKLADRKQRGVLQGSGDDR